MHFDFEWVTCRINLYKLFLCAFVFVESAKNKNGFTPLCVAALRGHVDIVRYLCSSCDANPSVATKVVITSRGSDNAYHDANVNNVAPCFDSYICTQNHRPPFLVSNSTDCHKDGFTPLFIAAQNGHVAVVRYLFTECFVDPDEPTKVTFRVSSMHCPGGQISHVSLCLRVSVCVHVCSATRMTLRFTPRTQNGACAKPSVNPASHRTRFPMQPLSYPRT